ncbi:DPH4 homolog [Condylostylus longicornis]|uniref:DPH4 homolog n=1 Tax=Condylostylus longicornis TaxID=2530218 RepID=UPI00244DD8E0|nr:DPH4 homolog [Condylostylus longicornis]
MSGEKTHWETLGILEGSDYETIRRAFRRKALEYHPDKKHLETEKTGEFQKVLNAFESLKKGFEGGDMNANLLHECRQSCEGNITRINLSSTQQLDASLYCYTCRCGNDIPIEVDELSIAFELHALTFYIDIVGIFIRILRILIEKEERKARDDERRRK